MSKLDIYNRCIKEVFIKLCPYLIIPSIILLIIGIYALLTILLGAPIHCYESYYYCLTHLNSPGLGAITTLMLVTFLFIIIVMFIILTDKMINHLNDIMNIKINKCLYITIFIILSLIICTVSGIYLSAYFLKNTGNIFNPLEKLDFFPISLVTILTISLTSILLSIFTLIIFALFIFVYKSLKILEKVTEEVKKEEIKKEEIKSKFEDNQDKVSIVIN